MPSERTGRIKENYDWKVCTFHHFYASVSITRFILLELFVSSKPFSLQATLTSECRPTTPCIFSYSKQKSF